jgi:hypothetical protein
MVGEQDVERLVAEGERVFYHEWDSGEGGSGAGTEAVYRRGDEYYAVMSYGGKPVEPYGSLWEAVEAIGLEEVSPATVAMGCTELAADELAVRLRAKKGAGHRFTINGEPWLIGEGLVVVPG